MNSDKALYKQQQALLSKPGVTVRDKVDILQELSSAA